MSNVSVELMEESFQRDEGVEANYLIYEICLTA